MEHNDKFNQKQKPLRLRETNLTKSTRANALQMTDGIRANVLDVLKLPCLSLVDGLKSLGK